MVSTRTAATLPAAVAVTVTVCAVVVPTACVPKLACPKAPMADRKTNDRFISLRLIRFPEIERLLFWLVGVEFFTGEVRSRVEPSRSEPIGELRARLLVRRTVPALAPRGKPYM